jgi:hypothetical protein
MMRGIVADPHILFAGMAMPAERHGGENRHVERVPCGRLGGEEDDVRRAERVAEQFQF